MTTLAEAGKLADNVPGLLLEAEKVAHSFMKGLHGRRRVGTGETFWQFRPWQPGDARRDIDWRRSARAGDVFVRQTEWEAAQTVWLWRDPSASMEAHGKKRYSEILLLAMGLVLLNGGEQVSLLGTGLSPQAGYPAIQRVYDALAGQTELAETGRAVGAHSHVMIFSDFYFETDELATFCGRLAARGVGGTLVQITHPDEETLPFSGRIKFEDIEALAGAEELDIAQVEALRGEYEKKFAAHRAKLADMAQGIGWNFAAFSTNVAPEAALTQLYNRLSAHA